MLYESTYGSGRKAFQPDITRGYWAQPTDFIFICLGLAFKLGIYAIIPYLLCCGLYIVPIMIIHSFMGQFSSSGFISAFRVSPLFKGMGYVSLALNFATLTYYSIFVTVPLLFFFNSFKPTLPWSFEAFETPEKFWNISDSLRVAICNASEVERIKKESGIANNTQTIYELPSTLFFRSHFPNSSFEGNFEFGFSWELFACTILTWGVIAGIFYKYFNTPNLGKILRCGIWIVLALLTICIIRFMFLPGAIESLSHYVIPKADNFLNGMGNVFAYSMMAFGPGWGSIITLSSFNKFDSNIMRDSWIISLGQMLIFMAFNFSAMLVNWHFSKITSNNYWKYIANHWDIYLSTAGAIANISFANFWCFLFYGMLTLAALIVMEGILYFSALSVDTLFTQTVLNLLLLFVILWIYGRKRFQRDIEFMLNQQFPTWKVHMLRFIAPLCLIIILFFSIANAIYQHTYSTIYFTIAAFFFLLLPWLSVPAYGFFITIQTNGPWVSRIKRSLQPTDWYPVAKKDRQRYEEAMGNENITQQSNEPGEEVI